MQLVNVERMERSQRRVHGRLCKIMVILKIPSWRMLLNWLLSRHRSAPNCSIASMEKAWKLAKKWWVKIQINIIKLVYICYLQIFNTLSLSERVFGVMMVLPLLKIFLTYFCFSAKTVNYIRGSCDKFYPQLNISGKHIEAFVKVISMTDMLLLNLLSEYVCHFILQIKMKGKGLKKIWNFLDLVRLKTWKIWKINFLFCSKMILGKFEQWQLVITFYL